MSDSKIPGRPLDLDFNSVVCLLVFNQPKRGHVTPLLIALHWLPVAAHIQFKALFLVYKTITQMAPIFTP